MEKLFVCITDILPCMFSLSTFMGMASGGLALACITPLTMLASELIAAIRI